MKQKLKIGVVVVLAAGVAAGGAAWKWGAPTKATPSHKIGGWSWGSGAANVNGNDTGFDCGEVTSGRDA